jgi:hypothetical protein
LINFLFYEMLMKNITDLEFLKYSLIINNYLFNR